MSLNVEIQHNPNFTFSLLQAYDQSEKLKAQVAQERELRSVTEGCLMEDRKTWQQIHCITMETRQHCGEVVDLVQRIR